MPLQKGDKSKFAGSSSFRTGIAAALGRNSENRRKVWMWPGEEDFRLL